MNRFQKYVNFALIGAAVAVGFLLKQMLGQIWDIFRLPMMENLSLPLPLPTLIAIVVALAVFIAVRANGKAMTFFNEVATELSKVSWPTKEETVQSTGVIIVMVGIASIIMFLYDTFWGTVTSRLLKL